MVQADRPRVAVALALILAFALARAADYRGSGTWFPASPQPPPAAETPNC